MKINPDMDMGELPSIFFRRFKDVIPNYMTFYDFAGNEVDVVIEKGHRTAIIVTGYKNLSTLYGLKDGGWLTVCFVGGDKFLIIEANDYNMCTKVPCFLPLKPPLDIKPTVIVDEVIQISDHTPHGSSLAQETPSPSFGSSPINSPNISASVSHAEHFPHGYEVDADPERQHLRLVVSTIAGGICPQLNFCPSPSAAQLTFHDVLDFTREALSMCGVDAYSDVAIPPVEALFEPLSNEGIENSNTNIAVVPRVT
ncbi:hypothetical protein HN51_063702 [Arachis hypogaea]|uniref:uncharacterized protein LOC110263149 n=1 Tax=Arachis ipaensis TaxID=130454 RepID=UPI000A2B8AF9|nr:uncharacterized protein LOC110263149 [Arachis ipaensis]XP_025631154.1 uncharacterized protein LOC112724095 [Arachis hypogaea]